MFDTTNQLPINYPIIIHFQKMTPHFEQTPDSMSPGALRTAKPRTHPQPLVWVNNDLQTYIYTHICMYIYILIWHCYL